MNKYESVIIVNPKLSESKLKELISKIESKIGQCAKITQKEDYGIKKLAYQINKNNEGHYLMYQFEICANKSNMAISEIERFYRITDEIMKFLTVKQ